MIVILKYNAGNIRSVENALLRIAQPYVVTDDPKQLQQADKIIFPGVGHAGSAMKYLKEKKLDQILQNAEQPVLGICLGLQLLCSSSEENNTPGLGIFNTAVKKFPPDDKVPHMGWNTVRHTSGALFQGIMPDSHFYFVHSYYAAPCNETIAECNYQLPFSAALQYKNFYAVQFHPEKSAETGEQLLNNFFSL